MKTLRKNNILSVCDKLSYKAAFLNEFDSRTVLEAYNLARTFIPPFIYSDLRKLQDLQKLAVSRIPDFCFDISYFIRDK